MRICIVLYSQRAQMRQQTLEIMLGKVQLTSWQDLTMMGSRGTGAVLSRAARMRQKLQCALEASVLDIEDVSYQHAGHAAVKDNANETHFNIKVISPKFEGQSLVKRHRMVYDLLSDELNSGLHAISIVAKTPKESGS